MINKIISLLETDDTSNWELAIQISEGLELCKYVYKKIQTNFVGLDLIGLRSRFLSACSGWELPTIGEIGDFTRRLDKCGIGFDLDYYWITYDVGCNDFSTMTYYMDLTQHRKINKKSMKVRVDPYVIHGDMHI